MAEFWTRNSLASTISVLEYQSKGKNKKGLEMVYTVKNVILSFLINLLAFTVVGIVLPLMLLLVIAIWIPFDMLQAAWVGLRSTL